MAGGRETEEELCDELELEEEEVTVRPYESEQIFTLLQSSGQMF